ncbi:MAG: hypothetical protein JSR59_09155 [Proteobacteria bacterium]|nr:hypothetical protein [Pseudomonadota bacterium]
MSALPLPANAAPHEEAPTVLDVEASGFGAGSYPIEVGYRLGDGRSYCSLIRPLAHWTHWDPQAERIHHVKREVLLERGREPAIVCRHLNDALRDLTVYCDGWAHDYTWLAMLYDAADMQPAFKLENLRALLTEPEAAHWHIVKQQVTTELRLQRHRASADARILQATLLRLRSPLPSRA